MSYLTMITLFVEENNTLTPHFYNKIIITFNFTGLAAHAATLGACLFMVIITVLSKLLLAGSVFAFAVLNANAVDLFITVSLQEIYLIPRRLSIFLRILIFWALVKQSSSWTEAFIPRITLMAFIAGM